MNLQQELEAAVSKTTAAAAKLHAIVNGDAGTVVETEAGAVKSLAGVVGETADALAALASLAQAAEEGVFADRALFSFALNDEGELIAISDRVELFQVARFELRDDGTVIIKYGEDL
ncbi:MAG: hypothetical protein HN377_01075 [Alphaproteobacteria bacterium]|jgi:hypothetical protein|nr:hypothetical protein [Alphaproteobacteria bacterium]MBT4085164.1 hypothetical protein [Alphaproteobacteria bacterium]MBT4543219.1 hypothetical protein [Alphaproteobacteria bacterium]MBT6242639.1 hypothetical protein [Rhodospirillaceae bacterium]